MRRIYYLTLSLLVLVQLFCPASSRAYDDGDDLQIHTPKTMQVGDTHKATATGGDGDYDFSKVTSPTTPPSVADVDQDGTIHAHQEGSVEVKVSDHSGHTDKKSVQIVEESDCDPHILTSEDEATGIRFRKIGLNGVPMPDEKPQQQEESDHQPEETYVDALTLTLHHDTSDIFIPVTGEQLHLEVRRSYSEDIWNDKSGLRPTERKDQPFGRGWSTNLAAHIEFRGYSISTPQSDCPAKGPPPIYAYVTDDDGSTYRFMAVFNPDSPTTPLYFPMPSGRNNQEAFLYSLKLQGDGSYLFTKKYGTVLRFVMVPTLSITIPQNRIAPTADVDIYQYAHCMSVTDRFGTAITYHYDADPHSLIPSSVSCGTQAIEITTADGLITSIKDPALHITNYHYNEDRQLDRVDRPENVSTSYGYSSSTDTDFPIPNDVPATYSHMFLTSLTCPNGQHYNFDYTPDATHRNFDSSVEGGYYIAHGFPMMMHYVDLPLGKSYFTPSGSVMIMYVSGNPTVISDRKTTVVDSEDNTRTYNFLNGGVISLSEFEQYLHPNTGLTVSYPNLVVYTKIEIVQPNGQAESHMFNMEAGMALAASTDLSGNTTSYLCGDSYTYPSEFSFLHQVLEDFPLAYYGDPTRQTDAYDHSKSFSYGPYRVMNKVVDEMGHTTINDVDSLGRRTSEKIYAGADDGPVLKETDYYYESTAFPNFVTKQIARRNAGDPTGWCTDLTTVFDPDSAGRMGHEVVDPAGLALTTSYTYDDNSNKKTVTDPLGHVTTFDYDDLNRLTKVTYPLVTGQAVAAFKTFEYNKNSDKTLEVDENGHATIWQYDELNRLKLQARDMDGDHLPNGEDLITRYKYNLVNSLIQTTDPKGHVTTMEYDALQRLVWKADPRGQITGQGTIYEYGENSGGTVFDSSSFKPTRIIDPRGYITDIQYDKLYRPIQNTVQYQLSPYAAAVTKTEYDFVGNPTKKKLPADADGMIRYQQTDYDGLNRPIKVYALQDVAAGDPTVYAQDSYTGTGLKWQHLDELGRVTVTKYDSAGRARYVEAPAVDDGTGTVRTPVTETIYDAASNVIATINPLGALTPSDPNDFRWDYTYDERNRKRFETQPSVINALTGTASRPVIETGYDDVGNVKYVIDAKGNRTDKNYDVNNRMVEVLAPAVHLLNGTDVRPDTLTEYDENGNAILVTDPNNHQTHNDYNELNLLWKTTDAENITVTNLYDDTGNLISVEDGKGQLTQFEYDGLKRNTAITDAAGRATLFGYDGLNKRSRTDALAQVTNYLYDIRNRLKDVKYVGRTVDDRTYTYDDVNNLKTVVEPGKGGIADVDYTYDALNRIITETSVGLTHQYTYDLVGNRVKTIYGGTLRTLVSTYDTLNRLWTLTEGSRVTHYGYDLNGNIAKLTQPNGDTTEKTFDALNRDTQIVTKTGGTTTLTTYAQTFDLAGNVVQVIESYGSGGLGNRTILNGYDAVNRLTSEMISFAGANVTTTGYTLDNANNRTQRVVVKTTPTGITTTATNYAYNNLNQLISSSGASAITYAYNLNGNLISRTTLTILFPFHFFGATRSIGYDFDNRPVSLTDMLSPAALNGTHEYTTYNYTYDYRTRRVGRSVGRSYTGNVFTSTSICYSGGTSVQELQSGSLTVEYVRGSDYGGGVGGILYTLRSGTPSFDHYNHRGDVVAQTNASGSLTYQAAYEAYGTRTAQQGATQDIQAANTKEEDPTGLLNEGMRYRDLETGVFITRDPAGFVDGPNLYTYVRQNPWTSFDPEGLWTFGEAGEFAVGAIVGFGEGATGVTGQPAVSPSNASGRSFGRNMATAAGGALMAKGTLDTIEGGGQMAVGTVVAPATGGASLAYTGRGAIQAGLGVGEGAVGSFMVSNSTKLGPVTTSDSGSSGSLEKSAQNTANNSQAEADAATSLRRDPKTGRFVSNPDKPPSTNSFSDAQRRATWKKLAEDPNSGLSATERAQIKGRGNRGPQRVNENGELETMELSHEPTPLREGGTEVKPRWPADHAAVDTHRKLKK